MASGEKGKIFVCVIGQNIDAGIMTESSKFDRVEEVEVSGSSNRSRLTGRRGQDWGSEKQSANSGAGSRRRRD